MLSTSTPPGTTPSSIVSNKKQTNKQIAKTHLSKPVDITANFDLKEK